MSSILGAVRSAMKLFNYAPHTVKLRRLTSTGGNATMRIPGTVTSTDFTPATPPSIRRITTEDAIANDMAVGDFRITLLFDSTLTETIFDSCAQVVYGVDILSIRKGSIVKYSLACNGTADSVEFVATAAGIK